MANAITYAGIALNLDTEELLHFADSYLPFDDARLTTAPRVYAGPRLLSATRPLHNVNRPRLAVGEWFYPVGMSRWGEVHLVVSSTNYNELLAKAFNNGTPVANDLVFSQGGKEVSTSMFLLEMRPIARMKGQPACWLACFVDERYFWQYIPVSMSVTTSTKWTDLIVDIGEVLSISPTYDSIPTAYLQPEPNSDLNSIYENVPILADAIAFNVGMRWVRNLDGTYKLQSAASAATVAASNKPDTWLAGGDALQETVLSNAILPSEVLVSFLKWSGGNYVNAQTEHIPYPKNTGDEFLITVALNTVAGFGSYVGSSAQKVFHDTAKAVYLHLTDASPTNHSQLQSLAAQIALDFYSWANDGLDQSFPLLAWLTPEGHHDITWTWNRHCVSTRVSADPWNYGVEELLHGVAVTPYSSSASSTNQTVTQTFVKSAYCDEFGLHVTDATAIWTFDSEGRFVSYEETED